MGEVYRAKRHEARPRGRDQGAARGVRGGPRAARPLRARGEAARLPQPLQHRPRVRLRERAPRGGVERPLPGHGAGGRRGPWRAAEARRDPGRGGAPDRDADRRGTRRGARARHRPPRPETGERQGDSGRQGQGARLRPRQGVCGRGGESVRCGPVAISDPCPHGNPGGRDPGHRGLHESRAGAGKAPRQARRHLGLRGRALRDAHRPEALRGGHGERRPRERSEARGRLEGTAGDDALGGAALAGPLPRAEPQEPPARHRGCPPRPRRSTLGCARGAGRARPRRRAARDGSDDGAGGAGPGAPGRGGLGLAAGPGGGAGAAPGALPALRGSFLAHSDGVHHTLRRLAGRAHRRLPGRHRGHEAPLVGPHPGRSPSSEARGHGDGRAAGHLPGWRMGRVRGAGQPDQEGATRRRVGDPPRDLRELVGRPGLGVERRDRLRGLGQGHPPGERPGRQTGAAHPPGHGGTRDAAAAALRAPPRARDRVREHDRGQGGARPLLARLAPDGLDWASMASRPWA